jgi:hypothetical protein
MTSDLDSTSSGTVERSVNRSYHIEFAIGMLGYLLALAATLIFGNLDGSSPWRLVWALLPVLPMVWIVVALLRHIRRVDEYQRFLLLQGLAVGFGVAMIASITLGFLGIAGLTGPLTGWIIFSAGMLGWLVAGTVARLR